ncbi:hypothetical protein JCM9279_004675 [Rhodotorula babjevae]
MRQRWSLLELLAALLGWTLWLLAHGRAAPLPTSPNISKCEHLLSESDLYAFLDAWGSIEAAAEDLHGVLVQRLERVRGERRRRNLVDEVCETLTDANSTLNIASENEPVGIAYEGDGLLDGIALSINPSILSGIFQTTTRTHKGAKATPTATARVIAIEGEGLLDGVDITLDPSLLRGLATAPSLSKSLLGPGRTTSARGVSETGGCEA